MMSSKIDATTPTLDEAALPEFNGATLFLADGSKVLNIKTVPNNDGSYANSNKLSSKGEIEKLIKIFRSYDTYTSK